MLDRSFYGRQVRARREPGVSRVWAADPTVRAWATARFFYLSWQYGSKKLEEF
jgi:hypothetical protein